MRTSLTVIVLALLLVSPTVLVATGTAESPAATTQEVEIQWWDQFLPLAPLHQTIWDRYMEENPNVRIEYSQYNPPDLQRALQLAYQSGQAPDVHTNVLGVPASRLIDEGWFQPLTIDIRSEFPHIAEYLFEGFTVFDGEVYSFPVFNPRQHTTSLWFNTDLMERAGIDTTRTVYTWDEVRTASGATSEVGGSGVYGTILPIQFTARMNAHVNDLAIAAGAPGTIDWRTGEYQYATEPYIKAVEFLRDLSADGTVSPASISLDARQARARWAAGEAAIFTDGPWNIGVLRANYAEFMDVTGVSAVPVATAELQPFFQAGPPGGFVWVSSQSDHPDVVSDILRGFLAADYYVGLAERMDQPPLDLSAVDRADVHPTYRLVLADYERTVRIAPQPLIRNPHVAAVLAEMRDVNPNLGEIVQGVYSGAVRDIAAELRRYNDAMTAERLRAIEEVRARGVEVSLDDWIFPDWDPSLDYGPEKY